MKRTKPVSFTKCNLTYKFWTITGTQILVVKSTLLGCLECHILMTLVKLLNQGFHLLVSIDGQSSITHFEEILLQEF